MPVALFPFFPTALSHLLAVAGMNLLGAGADIWIAALMVKTLTQDAWIQESGLSIFHGSAPKPV